jgi:salicylate 5-hydroxylase large subunit
VEEARIAERRWPSEGAARVPYWAYTDPDVYRRERTRVFEASWNYVALAAEVPNAGDFKRSAVGPTPVVVTRGSDGALHVFENRCAHRGVQFCRSPLGNTRKFTCPYHQWVYDLEGTLKGVPFERGVKGQGGMPGDFDKAAHRPRACVVAERGGVVFASFDAAAEPFEDYLGPAMVGYFDRVFDGRALRVLGYSRQRIPANWKLMFENIKDPYHASLLHVFLVSFGLFRADQPSAVRMDETGRHAVLVSRRGEQRQSDATRDIENLRTDFHLKDPRLLDPVREFPGDATVVMQTLWPNLIVQQQSNTLAMRHIVPLGPDAFRLDWTFFGYEDDDEVMVRRRLRQANLMGPAGYVSCDDSEVMKMSQEGIREAPEAAGIMEMGGRESRDEDHMVTEAAIRAFYDYYRDVMGF